MKNSLLIPVFLILLAGCHQVLTYYPLYHEKDLFPNNILLGIWQDKDSVLWKFDYKTTDEGATDSTAFILCRAYQDSASINWAITGAEARLLKIRNDTFIDLSVEAIDIDGLGDEKLFPYFVAPCHRFAKMEIKKDTISLFWPNAIWMGKMAKNKKLKLDYDIKGIEAIEGGDREMTIFIFSNTDKLQKFVARNVNNKEAFEEDPDKFARYSPH